MFLGIRLLVYRMCRWINFSSVCRKHDRPYVEVSCERLMKLEHIYFGVRLCLRFKSIQLALLCFYCKLVLNLRLIKTKCLNRLSTLSDEAMLALHPLTRFTKA